MYLTIFQLDILEMHDPAAVFVISNQGFVYMKIKNRGLVPLVTMREGGL
jgi:hypothetical protein